MNSRVRFLRVLTRIVLAISLSAISSLGVTPAQATNYTVTYDANASQNQPGVTSGSVPNATSYSAGATVTVAANSGNLARAGFTFAGWNTASDGSGTTYAPGSGSFTINNSLTLYADWTIPTAARLIGEGGSIVTVTNPNSVAGGSNCITGGIRGIASDGTYVYFRSSGAASYVCKVTMAGVVVAAPSVTGLSAIGVDSKDLAYSAGCLFLRSDGLADTSINCIDTTAWTMTTINFPGSYPLFAGQGWLSGNVIDFPDGRIGAVSAPNLSLPIGTGSGQCPSTFNCKDLRLYKVNGTGSGVTLTFSEDIILADKDSGWPSDDHGIATDGTYLYEIHFSGGYKVWALQSGSPSYLVFNGEGSGSCGAPTGVSGTLCPINSPTTGSSTTNNATFLGHNHSSSTYLMGDYTNSQFYKSDPVAPPVGPGSIGTTISSFGLPGGSLVATYRAINSLTATTNVAAKVTFFSGGKPIPGCKNLTSTGSGSSFTATCSWKPSQHNNVLVSATATSINGAVSTTSVGPVNLVISARTTKR